MTICSTKYVYLASIVLFELGSLLCGVAPSMNFLIFGRAVAGCGAAGYVRLSWATPQHQINIYFPSIFVSILAIIAEVTRLEDRSLLFGSFGAVFAVASATGPLLGGVFTGDK